jgi:hypothetical protein
LRTLAASLLVAALAFAPNAKAARAPTPDEKALAGAWRIESEDGSRRCALRLTSRPIPAGLVLEQPTPCADPYFNLQRVAAWKVERGALVFVTITGAKAAEFRLEGRVFASLSSPATILRPIAREKAA